jgi:hypothetical protein
VDSRRWPAVSWKPGYRGIEDAQLRALEMALTCHGTFDVDKQHIVALLSSKEDIADFTECSIIVHNRCPAVTDGLPESLKAMLQRHWRLSHFLEPVLRNEFLIEMALISQYAEYGQDIGRQGTGWVWEVQVRGGY